MANEPQRKLAADLVTEIESEAAAQRQRSGKPVLDEPRTWFSLITWKPLPTEKPLRSRTSAALRRGLLVSPNQRGTVDLSFMAALYVKSEEETVSELGDLVYH
jgi:hypothetical protein